MANIFVNATQARKDTRNNSAIHGEVRAIEAAVLANISSGVLYANISSGTTMTSSNAYYKAYYGVTSDPSLVDQVDYVTQYFTNLGYSVKVRENALTQDTITWNISW
jgi:hypothetical protein